MNPTRAVGAVAASRPSCLTVVQGHGPATRYKRGGSTHRNPTEPGLNRSVRAWYAIHADLLSVGSAPYPISVLHSEKESKPPSHGVSHDCLAQCEAAVAGRDLARQVHGELGRQGCQQRLGQTRILEAATGEHDRVAAVLLA